MATAHAIDSARAPVAIRITLTLIGAVIAVGLVLAGALTLLDLSARHTFDTRASYDGVQSLFVDDGGGDVVLTSAPAHSPLLVSEHVTEGLTTPGRRATRDRTGGLHLKASCPDFPGPECQVGYQIVVPSGVAVIVSSGAGDIVATNLTSTASVQLSSGAGDVTARQISAPNVKLDSGAGDVSLQLTAPAQQLEASSGAGDVTLTVPNATYAVHATSGAGNVSDQSLRIDPASPRTIHASSGAGNVTISPRP
jgi:hypothetical protein